MRALGVSLLLVCTAAAFPVPKGAGQGMDDTVWSGIDGVSGDTVTRFTFHAGGKMTYAYNGATHTDASWTQEGDTIRWEVNKRYREFEATRDGDKLNCKSHNKAGFRNEFTLTKVDADGK